ncbi:lysine 2,3-aminomutase [Persicimonas caeni]|uniref:Lysine 2,3-aminomutase n=1 Tax=Persicimonas caeni TaxID=2292766 RepID=A0A4Y6PU67_PERCE|nr:lysine 2,3-aminomutase [Persicimonas caeni]QDG51783.1 lysine 2,3-aminomutase [Persicimonas caeni]QED33004.1 lysine 2,3-aminomutase [Persicimonas caeni]
MSSKPAAAPAYKPITRANVSNTPQWQRLSPEQREAIEVVSAVLPFRTNNYVMQELIDWDRVPDDPIFRLNFAHRELLEPRHFARVAELLHRQAPRAERDAVLSEIRRQLNPHPGGQLTHNVPQIDGRKLPGLQHKYRETVLVFPSPGQTCHAYCTFCFRWAQFVGEDEYKFATREAADLVAYLKRHPEVTDVLITGGDPMVMKTKVLARYLEPLLDDPELDHVRHIRIGTKSLSYWPYRYLDGPDADAALRLFERVVESGKHLALMAHYNHPVELSTEPAQRALARVRSTGAVVRVQSPIMRHINDSSQAWAELWRASVRHGAIPYYMFVARDTGAQRYFEVPLVEAWRIFRDAYSQVSGLARTVRGPVMSSFPGKVLVNGVTRIGGRDLFALQLLQGRDPEWVGRPFFAERDDEATWLTDLVPASGVHFFFEQEPVASERRSA